MKITYWIHRQHLLGAAAFVLSSLSVFGQTVELSAPAPVQSHPAYGEQLVVPELPAPEWREESGVPVARLRLKAENAAGWRLVFRSLTLGSEGKMVLYGLSANGEVRAAHGPYERYGPTLQEFTTRVLEGAELVIEVRGKAGWERWPFELEFVERLDGSQLEARKKRGNEVEAIYRPHNLQEPAGEVRSTWFDGELVQYKVIDGMAVVGGDIVLGTVDEVEGGSAGKGDLSAKAHEDTAASRLWPNGVIPYTIVYESPSNPTGIEPGSDLEWDIKAAIKAWNNLFPGMLVPRTTQSDYVTIVNRVDKPCQSTLGRKGGQQFIWLQDGCTQGSIVHEIGHALGMWHEHQRPDRDQYVTILWQNIDPKLRYAFEIPSSGQTRMLGTYDYASVMHYSAYKASVNLQKTIQAPVNIGGRDFPQPGDEAGIRARYCNPDNWSMPGIKYVGPDSGTFSFTVAAPPYCTWTISKSASWLTVSGSLTRTGPSTVTFSVPWTVKARFTDIKITSTGSDTVRIHQEGENLNF